MKAAIKRVASQVGDGTGQVTNHEGNLIVSDLDSTSFRITQNVKGTAGRQTNAQTGAAPISVDAANVTVKGAGAVDGLPDDIDNGADGFFQGGSDDFASLTIQLTAQPNADDEIRFLLLKTNNTTDTFTEKFIFKAPDGTILNGEKDGLHTRVLIGTSLNETLSNLRLAIIESDSNGDKIKASLSSVVLGLWS